MDLIRDNWIRVFDISDTSKHIKGFTIYKIVSIVYPKNCPDAVTKVTVWKRYNDIKKLHRELKTRYKNLNINEKYPTLLSSSYFKRFDPDVINERRKSALAFLEFVGQYSILFKSLEFVRFFESSHTPQEALNSNINKIRAQLNLPGEPEILLCENFEIDQNESDSDTVSTYSNFSNNGNQTKDEIGSPEQGNSSSLCEEKKVFDGKNSCQDSSSTSSHSFIDLTLENSQKSPKSPIPESLQLESSENVRYITEAAQFITRAVEFELDKNFEESFNSYKAAIQSLLTGVKDDKDSKRRQMVRHKTEIYLLRAEKIYNLHLSPEMNSIKDCILRTEIESSASFSTKRPVAELFDYKVLKVVDRGLVVLNKKEQNIFFMKVIEKNSQTTTVYFNIPKDVPYMVKLFQYYDCFHSVFIVTQYVTGEKLFDYIKNKGKNSEKLMEEYSNLTFEREIDQDSGNFDEINSDSSDCSYSDLVLNYSKKSDSFLHSEQSKSSVDSEFYPKSDSCDKSQLKNSVSDNLLEKKTTDSEIFLKSTKSENAVSKILTTKFKRQQSDISFTEEFLNLNLNVAPLNQVKKWAAQLVLAIEKLHQYGIVITDLSPRNLLLDENENLKLTYIINFQEKNDLFLMKTKEYLAPEVLSPQKITFAVDWWSFGVILYELLTGIPLRSVHFEGIKKYTLLKIPKYVIPEGKSLLRQILVYEPENRLGCGANGIEDLKSHPFFNSIDWDQLLGCAFN